MARPRSQINQGLPKSLRSKKTKNGKRIGYYYKNPFYGVKGAANNTKKEPLLGYDREEAIKKAQDLDAMFAQYQVMVECLESDPLISGASIAKDNGFKKPNFVSIQTSDDISTVQELAEQFLAHNQQRYDNFEITNNTYRGNKSYINRIGQRWGHTPLEFVITANIQVHINEIIDNKTLRSANVFKDAYRQLLNFGKAKDLIYFSEDLTDNVKVKKSKVRRSRLSKAVAREVIESPELAYLPNKLFIEFSYCAGLRPMETALIRPRKGDDWEQKVSNYDDDAHRYALYALDFADFAQAAPYSYVDNKEQVLVVYCLKTQEITKYCLNIKSPVSEKTLGDIIEEISEACSVNESRYLLHHTLKNGKIKPGAAINPTTLSKKFTLAIKELDHIWANGSHPTLYESRSLAIRGDDIKTIKQDNCAEETLEEKASTLSEKVNQIQAVDKQSSLGGHKKNSKMPVQVYQRSRDMAHQLAKGFT